jgi:hypothetical protein
VLRFAIVISFSCVLPNNVGPDVRHLRGGDINTAQTTIVADHRCRIAGITASAHRNRGVTNATVGES